MKFPWIIVRRSRVEALMQDVKDLTSTLRAMNDVAEINSRWFEREQQTTSEQRRTITYLREQLLKRGYE